MRYQAICPLCGVERYVKNKVSSGQKVCRPCSTARHKNVIMRNWDWECPTGEPDVSMSSRSWAEWGWLAGIVDGEAHVGLRRNGRMPSIVVGMTDEDSVRRCQELTGMGFVYRRTVKRKKPLFSWGIYGKDARYVAWLLLPLLTNRKDICEQMARGPVG